MIAENKNPLASIAGKKVFDCGLWHYIRGDVKKNLFAFMCKSHVETVYIRVQTISQYVYLYIYGGKRD